MFSPYRTNPNRSMIPAILTALDIAYENEQNVEADIVAWLKDNLVKLSDNDKEVIRQWFSDRERCTNCGKRLLTTFTRDITTNPPVKHSYQFCPDCYI